MKYKDIKMFKQRCEEHPDHQTGMITYSMIEQRLHEEIDELREYIEQREWVGLTDKEINRLNDVQVGGCQCSLWYIDGIEEFAKAIEAKLREKNGC